MKTQKQNNKKTSSQDSFLEAFRDLGADITSSAKNDLGKKGAKDIFDSVFPSNQPNPQNQENKQFPFNPFSVENQLEKRYQQQAKRTEIIRREEKILFTRQQKETQEQVTALQEEIKKLAKTTADLSSQAKEAEITVMQEVPEVGTYHVNFFARLRKLIAELRSQIQESSFWLAAWNKKSQKRNYYWNQFRRSGSKFLLSSDRYVATQAG